MPEGAEATTMAEVLNLARDWTVDGLHKVLADVEIAASRDIDFRRFQIIDGALVMSPPPAPRHQILTTRLMLVLSPVMPAGYEIAPTVGIDLARSYLIPDLVVLPASRFADDTNRLLPADVPLVIEIVSPGSATMDRITKPAIYAAAGVGHYWRVESRPDVTITTYELDGSAYRETGACGPGETLSIERPFPLTVSLDELNRT